MTTIGVRTAPASRARAPQLKVRALLPLIARPVSAVLWFIVGGGTAVPQTHYSLGFYVPHGLLSLGPNVLFWMT